MGCVFLLQLRSGMWSNPYYGKELFVLNILKIANISLFSKSCYFTRNNCFQLINKQDQIIPLFVSQIMINVPSFTGLFMAGILSGSLSTVSSGLSSLAAIAFQDFIQAGCQWKVTTEKSTLITQGLSAGIGILCYALVYIIKFVPAVATVMDKCLWQIFSLQYLHHRLDINVHLFSGFRLLVRDHWWPNIRNICTWNVFSLGKYYGNSR